MLADLFHYWGGDLSSGNTGDVLTVTGTERGKQRILRRMMTNPADPDSDMPADYVWEPDYGAGLPRLLGSPIDIPDTTATIMAGLALEDVVAKTPTPQVAIVQLPSDLTEFTVTIDYVDAPSDTPVTLSFTVSN